MIKYLNYLIFMLSSSFLYRSCAPGGMAGIHLSIQHNVPLWLNPQFSIVTYIYILLGISSWTLAQLTIGMNLKNWGPLKGLPEKDIHQTNGNPTYGVILLPVLKKEHFPHQVLLAAINRLQLHPSPSVLLSLVFWNYPELLDF